MANKEEDARRKNAINYLGSIEKKLQEEFSADLSVKSFVVIGADCGALKVVLNDINPSIVILGPDSDEHSIVSFLQSNIGDFLSAKMGIPVLKISRIPEN